MALKKRGVTSVYDFCTFVRTGLLLLLPADFRSESIATTLYLYDEVALERLVNGEPGSYVPS